MKFISTAQGYDRMINSNFVVTQISKAPNRAPLEQVISTHADIKPLGATHVKANDASKNKPKSITKLPMPPGMDETE